MAAILEASSASVEAVASMTGCGVGVFGKDGDEFSRTFTHQSHTLGFYELTVAFVVGSFRKSNRWDIFPLRPAFIPPGPDAVGADIVEAI